ncbi:uncharacterized protein [Oncorhynchus clarkii lewisi]|uniref:uncharacterized protein n=1 Tax=Oncorhynchus clarkii lewisi TaxID=490388 RepID=UPI0039B8E050
MRKGSEYNRCTYKVSSRQDNLSRTNNQATAGRSIDPLFLFVSFVVMARHWRLSSEGFPPVSGRFGSTGGLRTERKEEEEEERSPIYSLSKSSMDVVMATKHPHLRDPAWAKLELRRSASQNTQSSTNTHTPKLTTLQQYIQQPTPSHSQTSQNIHGHGSPLSNERVARWSMCSASVCSSVSTPETVIWKGGSMTEETPCILYSARCSRLASESQSSIQTPATPSPFTSPLNTPTQSPTLHTRHNLPQLQYRPSPLTAETPCQTHTPSPMSSPLPIMLPLPSPLSITSPLPSPLAVISCLPSPLSITSPLPSPPAVMSCLPSPLSVTSPLPSPPAVISCLPSPLTPKGCRPNPYTDEACSPHKHPSSPFPSPSCRAQGVEDLEERGSIEQVPPQPGCTPVGMYYVEKPPILSPRPRPNNNTPPLGVCLGIPVQQQEVEMDPRVFFPSPPAHLALSWSPRLTCPSGRGQISAGLVSSLSDSQLDGCPRCSCNSAYSGVMNLMTSLPQGSGFREEGTMTSQRELVEVGVQAGSPQGSRLNFRSLQSSLKDYGSDTNLGSPPRSNSIMGYNTYLGSQSILGSPPGSRLNLRSSLGSHSNLVSPSSSMFPLDIPREGWEEKLEWEDSISAPLGEMGRRRSCLKVVVQEEERRRSGEWDHSKRRSSMKQVQWDEDGMTWDVYGASLDPEELSSAIQKHLQLKTRTDNTNTETTPKTKPKTKSKSRVKIISKTKSKTASMETTTLSTPVNTKRKTTAMATSPMALSINTVATAAIETEADTKGEGVGEGEKEGEGEQRQREPEGEVKVEREEEGKLEGDSEGGVDGKGKGGGQREGGLKGEETEEKGTPVLSRKSSYRASGQSRKKSGGVMKSLKRCVHSSNPNE